MNIIKHKLNYLLLNDETVIGITNNKFESHTSTVMYLFKTTTRSTFEKKVTNDAQNLLL
jgi:hypothetical protein